MLYYNEKIKIKIFELLGCDRGIVGMPEEEMKKEEKYIAADPYWRIKVAKGSMASRWNKRWTPADN